MMFRDWQFRRQMIPMLPAATMPVILLFGGSRATPFSGTFTPMHILPHALGALHILRLYGAGLWQRLQGRLDFPHGSRRHLPRIRARRARVPVDRGDRRSRTLVVLGFLAAIGACWMPRCSSPSVWPWLRCISR